VKRFFDLTLAIGLLPLILPAICLISILVKLTSKGPVLHWSKRVGRNNTVFLMPKFRTMRPDTPQLATHLMTEPGKYLTPIGAFLRKSSLDELPQIFSIVFGDLGFVGPRPALFNQDELVSLRTERGIHKVRPGLTGWAQVNGRDDLPIPVKVGYDFEYMQRWSLLFDIKILALTALKVVRCDGVSH
jgi:O-antigen biosynthesis protein WbqP